jgi:uncharacterized membrane protein HdeD (DUF308 family)
MLLAELETAAHHWWAFALRGVIAVLFGILAFVMPGITLAALVLLWGAYALVDGVLALISAFRTSRDQRLGLVLEGIVGIAAGVVTLIWPAITALVLLYIIATWALLTGALEIWAAVRLRKVISNEWWLVATGIASIVFAVVLIIFPDTGALAVIWTIGAYAILFGVLMIALAFKLHGLIQRRTTAPSAA